MATEVAGWRRSVRAACEGSPVAMRVAPALEEENLTWE